MTSDFFMGQVSQQWFDDFNRECDEELRQFLRDMGMPIDLLHEEFENNTVQLLVKLNGTKINWPETARSRS